MLASFQLLKPFGRFIELGKKDFLENTYLGLRPFVRNIVYAGVDLDEWLNFDRKGAERLMQTLGTLFDSGELRPLPHQIYEAHEIGAAFRAMQASEHVGKIVIRPPTYGVVVAPAEFAARAGAYLIVGGVSGLGFATAQWLARKGATSLILVSRRGQVEEALQPEVERLRQSGVTIEVAAVDVRDALAALKYNSIHIVALHMRKDAIGDHFALYFADPDVIFHRLSKLNFLGEAYCHEDGGSTLLVEVTFRPDSYLALLSAEDVQRRVIDDLFMLKLIDKEDVISSEVRTEQYAYVIYDLDHRKNADKVLGYLEAIGVRSAGRFAQFEYLNSDGVVENTLKLARELNLD
jgi:hypothetical protein